MRVLRCGPDCDGSLAHLSSPRHVNAAMRPRWNAEVARVLSETPVIQADEGDHCTYWWTTPLPESRHE